MKLAVATCRLPIGSDVRKNLEYVARQIRTAKVPTTHPRSSSNQAITATATRDFFGTLDSPEFSAARMVVASWHGVSLQLRRREMSLYRVLVKKHPNGRLPESFESVQTFDSGGGETVISVDIADQTALRDLLVEVRNLGLSLVSVARVEPPEETPASK